MGVLSGDPAQIGNQVSNLVTNTGLTIYQLSELITGFAGLAAAAPLIAVGAGGGPVLTPRRPSIRFADPPSNVPQAVQTVLKQAKGAATTTFTQQYPGVTPAGVDAGCVTNYTPSGGNLQNVVQQMAIDFNNWNLPVAPSAIGDMAETIAEEMSAQLGIAGTAYGAYYLNENQMIDWAVAYGEFVLSSPQNGEDNNGLIYAFTAALGGGW